MLYLRKIIIHSQKIATYLILLSSRSKLKLEVVSTRTLYKELFMQFPKRQWARPKVNTANL